jgi:hypothetical protein
MLLKKRKKIPPNPLVVVRRPAPSLVRARLRGWGEAAGECFWQNLIARLHRAIAVEPPNVIHNSFGLLNYVLPRYELVATNGFPRTVTSFPYDSQGHPEETVRRIPPSQTQRVQHNQNRTRDELLPLNFLPPLLILFLSIDQLRLDCSM